MAVTGKLKANCRNGANLATFDQDGLSKSAVLDNATDTLTVTSHGWLDNQSVRLYFAVTPTGLSNATTYFLVNTGINSFQISLTSGRICY